MNSLVTDFDDEELPLRKEEKFEQFVVDFDGDEGRARQNMTIEQTSFDTHKDFTQLLTDAAMKAETTHSSVSSQKLAFALSKDWVLNAYNDIVAQNRMKIPNEIEINIDTFATKTTDGQNEKELVDQFNQHIDSRKSRALSQYVLSSFEQFCLYGGAAIGIIGLFMFVAGSIFLGAIAVIAGIAMVLNHNSKKKQIEQNKKTAEEQFEKKRETGVQIIRATLAEVVDFRLDFSEHDAESQSVIDFLEQISPDQYVRKLATSNRRIKM